MFLKLSLHFMLKNCNKHMKFSFFYKHIKLKDQREQYFKEQRVLNIDSKIKKREDGKWPLYIETWKTLLAFQRATGGGCLVCL